MVKFTALSAALLAGSAAAFAPATLPNARLSKVQVSAEKSASLPFMNRPPLVS